ncbi:hypothetical protein G6L33_07705 [Agrobacterium rhizogenes]|nr:hypothetical protein [Rhizobium rhizogenes]
MLPAPFHHAWLVTSAGDVLDPTWHDADDHVYFGIAFDRAFIADMLVINGNEPGILVNLKPLSRLLRSQLDIEQAIVSGRISPAAR